MIGWLRGRVLTDEVEGSVLLDVGGVGYELITPAGTVARLRKGGAAPAPVPHASASGELIELCVHTNVREDALELFGFASREERRCFRLLLSVPKVGPRVAISVLSALPPSELARAVQAGDLQRLTKIPGVGRRTAERIVTELKDKVAGFEVWGSATEPEGGTREPAARLLGALTNMGYKPAEARRAVDALGPRIDKESLAELIRAALAELAS